MNWIGLIPVGMFVAGLFLFVRMLTEPVWTWKGWAAAIVGAIATVTGISWLLPFLVRY